MHCALGSVLKKSSLNTYVETIPYNSQHFYKYLLIFLKENLYFLWSEVLLTYTSEQGSWV